MSNSVNIVITPVAGTQPRVVLQGSDKLGALEQVIINDVTARAGFKPVAPGTFVTEPENPVRVEALAQALRTVLAPRGIGLVASAL